MKMMFCVVPECDSTTASHPHLAYHKFPSCSETKRIWLKRMRLSQSDLQHHTPQVCSKHFRKDDYLPYHKTCKRMLKKGAVPSTFPWGDCDPVPSAEELHQEHSKPKQKKIKVPNVKINKHRAAGSKSNDVPDSGGHSLDDSVEGGDSNKDSESLKTTDVFKDPELFSKSMIESENSDHGSVTDASSVSFTPEKCYGRSGKHGECKYMPGVRLEAKDLSSNKWWKAKVVEVDWEDDEVLIHFEKWSNRFDEWIPMDSSRLRPVQTSSPSNQTTFRVGETVMATWTDNKKYAARIKSILSGDKYEVLFFDGFCKVVKGHKISKGTEETLAMDPGLFHNAGPTTMTKAERREKKRKIGSFAELFQMKKKPLPDAEKSALKKKADSDKTREDSSSKGSTSHEEKRRDSEGKSRHRSFPVIKGFGDADKSRGTAEKKTKGKTTPAVSQDVATTSIAKEVLTTPLLPIRAKRRKRDDNIDPADYLNWEPEGEEAWLVESAEGLRRSIKVRDDRLPSGWAKHTIQRKSGNSAGKWDVFLVSPTGRRFRSRKEMHAYFADSGQPYNPELFDFTLRCNMRRKSSDAEPIHFKKKPPKKEGKSPSLSASELEGPGSGEPPVRRVKTLLPKSQEERGQVSSPPPPHSISQGAAEGSLDDRVLIGNLKIQTENDAFICPKEGCSKHFRKENLLQMHMKHYHPEYSRFLGSTPNVADLAYARTVGESPGEQAGRARSLGTPSFLEQVSRFEAHKKARRPPTPAEGDATPAAGDARLDQAKRVEGGPLDAGGGVGGPPEEPELPPLLEELPPLPMPPSIPEPTPTLPADFLSGPTPAPMPTPAGIKTLLPVARSPAAQQSGPTAPPADPTASEASPALPGVLSAHARAETTPAPRSKAVKKRRLSDMYIETLKKRRLGKLTKCLDDSAVHSQVSARFGGQQSRYRYLKKRPVGGGGQPSPTAAHAHSPGVPASPLYMSEPDGSPASAFPPVEEEAFEQLQKRDIINCTCGVMEEDGLMIQCDLCLCWQHVLCNTSMEEVPDKYVCSICLNPARERKASHYLHDQYWLKDGALPSLSFRTKDTRAVSRREGLLKRSHDLTGELLGYKDVLHSLRVKLSIAEQPDHPKLYLWAEKPASAPPNPEAPHEGVEMKQEALPCKTEEGEGGAMPGPGLAVKPEGGDQEKLEGKEESKGTAAVQDHTYVHVAGTKQTAAACVVPAEKPEDPLKLEGQILLGAPDPDPDLGMCALDAATQNQLLQLPICQSELMHLASSMADNLKDAAIDHPALPADPPPPPPKAPQPEKPIDPLECRINLLDQIEDFQEQLDTRLSLIEEQVAALEAEDPEPPSEETATFYPQTKHTLQMINRDLATMKKLAIAATGYTVVKW